MALTERKNYTVLLKIQLMRKFQLFLTALLAFVLMETASLAQSLSVSGVVKDQAGSPVQGVTVLVEGTKNGTYTDANGKYMLSGVPSNGTLVFSCIGYVEAKSAVNGQSTLPRVTIWEDTQALDETIVVAFGTSTKSSFTGSAAVVNEEKLQQAQVSSVTNALAGAVAGVQLTSSNGAPGSTSTIRVRGFSSINAGQDPLIIVDGAPYGGDLTNLNSADVESMTVLKDAAASALYGARGANGVILINTKKAKSKDATVIFDAKVGVNTRALRQYRVIKNPKMYYETHYAAYNNYLQQVQGMTPDQAYLKANADLGKTAGDGGVGYIVYTVPEGQNLIGTNGKLNPAATLGRIVNGSNGEDYYLTPDSWSDEGYREGIRQEYNLSVAGGGEKSNVYFSLAYLDNEGITDASDLTRFTGRLRADYQAKKWMKVGANIAYTRFNGNTLGNNGSTGSNGNVWAFTSQTAPIYPIWVRNADGSIKVDANGIKIMDYGNADPTRGGVPGSARPFISDANPIQDSRLNTRNYNGNSMSANGFADFTILPGLVATVNGTVYLDETRSTYVYNPYYGQFRSTEGTIEKYHQRYFTYNYQQLINYTHTFAGVHNFGAMVGHEYYNARSYELGASKSKMFSQTNKELSGAVVDGQSSYSTLSEYNNEGYFGRIQYDYDTKYFISGSYRRDASSRFNPDYRWGSFWSVGAAWIMSKEKWFKAPWVDELKLKASVGSQGNDNIGNYRYTDLFDIVNSAGSVGTSFNSKGTKDITWETNTNFNIGAEFSFWKKLSGSIEYFRRNTSDMLFSFSVAPSLGYSSYYDNIGDLYNSGIEIELSYNIFSKKNLSWDVNFNLTTLKNRVTKLHDDKKVMSYYTADGKEYMGYGGDFFISEDRSMYSWRLKDFAGVDQETGESLWYKNTFDKEGVWTGRETTSNYSDADYYITNKSTIPDVYGGLGSSLRFFGFDFSFNLSYQIGGYQYDGTYAQFMSNPTSGNTGYNFHADVLKAWTPEKPSNSVPRWVFGDTYSAGSSTRFLTKSSYLNIENINFGYTLPSKWTKKFDVSALRIYFAAENVWYWSARRGFDPRQSFSGGTNATNYSPMRTLSGGINIKF